MRKKIVAGNWKMNHLAEDAYKLARKIERYAIEHSHDREREIILAPPFLYLEAIADNMHLLPSVKIAAQNCHQKNSGAYTGEVAADMLSSIGVDCVIVGHSERRAYFKETHEILREKVDNVLVNGIQPIFCCGEPEEIRDAGTHEAYVQQQLIDSLLHLNRESILKCVIAYEPIWAIGTGKTATSDQAQEMHAFIRSLLKHKYGGDVSEEISILYGGSVKASNALEIFGKKDVDGGLIGGASLNFDDFIAIIEAAKPG
ncbi:MAG: triose-phosphate isomerase [Bacteroidetes bacterium]|nr:triose-phosphate isomerase [Bacteroidota bacterium]